MEDLKDRDEATRLRAVEQLADALLHADDSARGAPVTG